MYSTKNIPYDILKVKVDPEFSTILPPATAEEDAYLDTLIVKNRMIYSPFVIWNDILIDGHRRLKVLQNHPDLNIKYTVIREDEELPDRKSVIAWICNNELGRGHLNKEQYEKAKQKIREAQAHIRAIQQDKDKI